MIPTFTSYVFEYQREGDPMTKAEARRIATRLFGAPGYVRDRGAELKPRYLVLTDEGSSSTIRGAGHTWEQATADALRTRAASIEKGGR
jgi:hypothetical protein